MNTSLTLALDASTAIGTVAVWRGTTRIAEGEAAMRDPQVERLLPAVIATLAEGGASLREVERVVCGAGPGSFTSLRIAAAIAKGIVTGTHRRATLHAVPSLALIVAARADRLAPGRFLTLLDAMREERYAQLVVLEPTGVVRVEGPMRRIATREIAAECAACDAQAIGPAEMIDAMPHARGALAVAGRWDSLATESLDGWEPTYGRLAEAQAKWEAAHGRPLPG